MSTAGIAVGKDAAFKVFAKRLAHKGLWRVVAALPVELAVEPASAVSMSTYAAIRRAMNLVAHLGEIESVSGWSSPAHRVVRTIAHHHSQD